MQSPSQAQVQTPTQQQQQHQQHQQQSVAQQASTSTTINTSKSAMITLFKQNHSKITTSGIVQIADQQPYQGQPVTLTILNSPSIPTSSATICLSNPASYANLVMKSQESTADSIAGQMQVPTAQSHCQSLVSTVVVASSASDSHNAVQYLVPAVQNIYMSPSGFSIPISGQFIFLEHVLFISFKRTLFFSPPAFLVVVF